MSIQQTELVKNVQNTLVRSGYITSKGFKSKSSCFDLTARRERLLFIKCLLNVDNFKQSQKNELILISNMFTGSPVLIGERNKHKEMENGVVYNKSGIPTLSFSTFQDLVLNDIIPYIYARRGGFFVKINESSFEHERSELEFSLSELAEKVGVSRKTIYSYEHGKMDASLKIYKKLKNFFSSQIEKPVEIYTWELEVDEDYINELKGKLDDLRNDINEIFMNLGLEAIWPKKALFDAITTEDEDSKEEVTTSSEDIKIITGLGSRDEKTKVIYQKIQQIESISQVIPSPNLFITEDKRHLPGVIKVPIIEKKKLEKLGKEDLFKKISNLLN
ncbi:MAG: helix-turn-helix domain-containing protein [Candidatus Helarchaeota archaeon]|nr:helix-turn-helix domain-containing protein [Candidatus Helarchaeota archaeon]